MVQKSFVRYSELHKSIGEGESLSVEIVPLQGHQKELLRCAIVTDKWRNLSHCMKPEWPARPLNSVA
jgi:hypothetical protein